MYVYPFSPVGDLTLELKSPHRQRVFQLLPPCPHGITSVFGKPRGTETSLQGTKVGLAADAGHSLSFLRLLIWVGVGVSSAALSCGKGTAGSGHAVQCWLVASLTLRVPQLSWIQLLPRNLILTNVVLGQLALPNAGNLRPQPQSAAGCRFGRSPRPMGSRWSLKSSLEAAGRTLLVLEVREYRSGEYAFKDFSSDCTEDGLDRLWEHSRAEQSPPQNGRSLSPSPGRGKRADGEGAGGEPKERRWTSFSALVTLELSEGIYCRPLSSPPDGKPHEANDAVPSGTLHRSVPNTSGAQDF